jgi:hypothetical protein
VKRVFIDSLSIIESDQIRSDEKETKLDNELFNLSLSGPPSTVITATIQSKGVFTSYGVNTYTYGD